MRRALAILSVLLLALAAPSAPAAGTAWLMGFECRVLDRVFLPEPTGPGRRVWYCTYRLQNGTGMDRDLALGIYVETDASGLPGRRPERRADVVHPTAQRAVEAHEGRRDPYLDAVQIQGRIRRDASKEGIAVFGELSPETDVVVLYVVGLSSADRVSRLGADYERMIRAGTEVCLFERGRVGGYDLKPLARRIDKTDYQRLSAQGGASLLRRVTEFEGEHFLALDHPMLTDADPHEYVERRILRRRYSRGGDEFQPHLDTYKLDGEDLLLALTPVLPDGTLKP